MSRVNSGGGWAAIWYSLEKSFKVGPIEFWRRMFSKNSCKTCAYGMGGQDGGMRNEAGSFPEFCKKSVQAMAADMQPPIAEDFFDRHSVDELARLTPRELENLGRISYPIALRSGETHFRQIDWNEALDKSVGAMRRTDPRRSFFYSSGRSSNEAAFLLQLLARIYGTNNVHNCSYYCHQASGVGLGASVGSGTATVVLDDLHKADFVMLIGANPASNHPRIITELAALRKRGGKVVVVNPMRETGLDRFNIPSKPGSLLFGSKINDLYIQPSIGGDIAFLKAVLKIVMDRGKLDEEYIAQYTNGFEALCTEMAEASLEELSRLSGVSLAMIEETAGMYAEAKGAIFMWAMGITHHEHGSDNVAMIANLALARGMVGREGAGLMPIRGHSNVQGIGSVGFTPELKDGFLKRMEELYELNVPAWKGMDSMECIHAAHKGDVDFALLMGGNFYASNPALHYAEEALSRIGTTVHISTKLNQGHVVPRPVADGGEVIILPTFTRDEELQTTTQESMFSYVRLSEGGMRGPQGKLRTETDIVTSIAGRLLPDGPVDFLSLKNHNDVRQVMAQVVPGYEGVGKIGQTKEEFHVAGRVRHQPRFNFPDGRARFIAVKTPHFDYGDRELMLMTIRSEGQFNTVVYEEHDRYRNQSSRDVIMMSSADIERLGLRDGERVTVVSETGQMENIRVSRYDVTPGSAAMYYPEANILVPTFVDNQSRTPGFKNVRIRIESNS
ncbi:MAG: FdhF/YdeP family oxidoreductase [Candidatus Kapaibacterium sp.]